MALEPAGVSLAAEGLNKYINDLKKIDKQQREVFEAKFKGTGLSFQEVTKLAKDYERQLESIAKAERKAAREAEKAADKRKKAAEKAAREQERASQARRGAIGQVVGGVAGAAIAGGPAGFAVAAAQEFNEFRRESIELSRVQAAAEAQLSAAIRSTGGVAGLTANQLKAQAAALQEVTNFGDEATIAAQAQLLTFTKIGGETFPRATKAILDLATRMDGDLKGATIQVGKALNDPIAGLSALSRSGVQFSAQQKELVKGFVETNNLSAAQAVILEELEKQFGGAAEAAREADGGNIALQNSFGDLQEELGEVFISFGKVFNTAETGIKIIGFLQERIKTLQQVVAFAGAGFAGFGSVISQTFDRIVTTAKNIGRVFKGEVTEPIKTFDQILDEASSKAILKFKEVATVFGETFDEEPIEKINEIGDNLDEATDNLDAYTGALRQAENLQLSFARAAEDSARKLARANEDIARKQAQQVGKLQEKQAKDRDKLLQDQAKRLDEFEKDRRKQIARAEGDIRKARREAGEQRKRDQQKLQRALAQAQARFNLSQLQSERRFKLQESRLRAEGDILALKELREDFALQQQEEKENFDLSKREQIDSAKTTQREQAKDLDTKLKELKTNLEEQRADLLASFDEQLRNQQQAQQEARQEQQIAFEEAAAERAIQLAREEEDRRISQRRQLEDLGRSLAEQQGVTQEGALAIAGELEKVFGIEGVADNIITGFTEKTESEFKDLFDNLADIAGSASIPTPAPIRPQPLTAGGGGRGSRIGGIPEFQEGGIVPGPLGSPQIIQAHAGERVVPISQQMIAPVVGSQSLDVNMSGGFNISGGDNAGDAAVQAALVEMTENFRIAVQRLARRN